MKFKISKTRCDLIANFFGKGWTALISFIFIPVYIHYLGIESYGLIGFFAALQGSIALFDMGLSTTLNREFARRTINYNIAQEIRDLLKTLQTIYILVGIGIAIFVIYLAPFISSYWLNAEKLSYDSVVQSIIFMGIGISVQWPIGFFLNGLMGLDKQVLSNILQACFATIRSVGAVLILSLVQPTVVAYFAWQAAVGLISFTIVAITLWRILPGNNLIAKFRLEYLKSVWKFSAGMTVIGITSLMWSQIDKVLLSKLLMLKIYGSYMLAYSVSVAINFLSYPILNAMFPKFTQLLAQKETQRLTNLYHSSCQMMSVTLVPVSIAVAFFAKEVIFIWTGDIDTAAKANIFLTALSCCTLLGGLGLVPQTLQLAAGWTRLIYINNIIGSVIILPILFFGVPRFGAVIVPIGSAIFLLVSLLIIIHLMHRHLLPGEKMRWYTQDVGLPFLVSLVIAIVGRLIIDESLPRISIMITLGGILLIMIISSVLSAGEIRRRILSSVI